MQFILPFLFILSAYYLSKHIRANSIILYTLALILSSISLLYPENYLSTTINSGAVGLAFFLVVMYTGVFKKGSSFKKQLSSVRREYAILGFLFITPHAYLNIIESIFNVNRIEYIGLAAFIVMIPLFVTSFQIIKRSIPTSRWIRIHRYSYLAYYLIFIHIIIISDSKTTLLYFLLFIPFTIIKASQYFTTKRLLKTTSLSLFVLATGILLGTDYQDAYKESFNILEGNVLQDGTYIGYAKGYRNIDTTVRVEIKDNEIISIFIEECGCTPNADDGLYYDAAIDTAYTIRLNNRTDIDSISGATKTSDAVTDAVVNALENAIKGK